MKTQKEVITFLYETAETLKENPKKIKELPDILTNYAIADELPRLYKNKNQYYDEIIGKKLPNLQQENESLYKVLHGFAEKHPPLCGAGVGSHVSYEMVRHNDSLIS